MTRSYLDHKVKLNTEPTLTEAAENANIDSTKKHNNFKEVRLVTSSGGESIFPVHWNNEAHQNKHRNENGGIIHHLVINRLMSNKGYAEEGEGAAVKEDEKDLLLVTTTDFGTDLPLIELNGSYDEESVQIPSCKANEKEIAKISLDSIISVSSCDDVLL